MMVMLGNVRHYKPIRIITSAIGGQPEIRQLLYCPAVFGHFNPAPIKQIVRYESIKPIKSKLTYHQSVNQSTEMT